MVRQNTDPMFNEEFEDGLCLKDSTSSFFKIALNKYFPKEPQYLEYRINWAIYYIIMECSKRKNWNNLFCHKVSILTGPSKYKEKTPCVSLNRRLQYRIRVNKNIDIIHLSLSTNVRAVSQLYVIDIYLS